jgi:RNA recognition motif. (a.k.a. RRM, RBD, or RNP domain)
VPTNQKPTSNKRAREQDQKERAAERIARRTERKARASARQASGQVGPQIAEPAPPDVDVLPPDPAAPNVRPAMAGRTRPDQAPTSRIYVGNLSYNMDANSIASLFAPHGAVTDVHIVLDQVSRRPRGFAFVTMASPAEAQAAITALDGQTVDGRTLSVNQAEAREPRPSMSRRY